MRFQIFSMIMILLFAACSEEEVNIPPMFDVDAIVVKPPSPVEVNRPVSITANAIDPEGDSITYTWSVNNSRGQNMTEEVISQITGKAVILTLLDFPVAQDSILVVCQTTNLESRRLRGTKQSGYNYISF